MFFNCRQAIKFSVFAYWYQFYHWWLLGPTLCGLWEPNESKLCSSFSGLKIQHKTYAESLLCTHFMVLWQETGQIHINLLIYEENIIIGAKNEQKSSSFVWIFHLVWGAQSALKRPLEYVLVSEKPAHNIGFNILATYFLRNGYKAPERA